MYKKVKAASKNALYVFKVLDKLKLLTSCFGFFFSLTWLVSNNGFRCRGRISRYNLAPLFLSNLEVIGNAFSILKKHYVRVYIMLVYVYINNIKQL